MKISDADITVAASDYASDNARRDGYHGDPDEYERSLEAAFLAGVKWALDVCGPNAEVARRCPGLTHRDHVADVCEGSCCTACGGPIDSNEECRCG